MFCKMVLLRQGDKARQLWPLQRDEIILNISIHEQKVRINTGLVATVEAYAPALLRGEGGGKDEG